MGTFTDIEIAILDRFTEVIDGELWSIHYDNVDKDRMLYAACLNEKEKDAYTKKQIKKMQKRISKCSSDVAVYISTFLNEYQQNEYDGDFYDYRKSIVRNFFSSYSEGIEEIAKDYNSIENVEKVDESFFEISLYKSSSIFNTKEIKDFIRYMSVAERLVVFKSILKQVEEEKNKSNLDDIIKRMQTKVDAKNARKIKNSLAEILDNLRGQNIGSLQLYKIVKDQTNLSKDALEYLKQDIGWYLFSMKMAQDCFYTEEQVSIAFNKVKAKGYSEEELLEMGYLKNTKMFFEEEYVDPEEPIYINKEKLLYPAEFTAIKELLEVVKKELAKLESVNKANEKEDSFDSIFNVNKQQYILQLLEDLAITKQNQYALGMRAKGSIRGVVEALRDENIIPNQSLDKLCKIIATKINLELKSKLDWSNTSDSYCKKTKEYIKNNPL